MDCGYIICDPFWRGVCIGFLAGIGSCWFGFLCLKIGWDARDSKGRG